ncbi:MAG: DUF2304 domain-containing protein [Candidatus Eisenbacteria bacterium]|uniref:DUF2304 domain-containing protein n=1 Tax=Eiseniibacteriota bacterium TaxID=2212470 RepID=A0A538TVX6_UNCEI|nr:MAG: DUF2304 domain-containing protein [Candidatus Eisenbacteria bacterium]
MQPALYTGLQLRAQLFVVGLGVLLLLFILNQVRRKNIREEYSLLWILSAVVMLLSATFIRSVERLSHLIGIYYPPAFLFLIAILIVLMLQYHFSTVISTLREQNKNLTQDLGILEAEVRDLRRALDRSSTQA